MIYFSVLKKKKKKAITVNAVSNISFESDL